MKLKSIIALSLATVMSISMLVGCDKAPAIDTPVSSDPPPVSSEPPEPEKAESGLLATVHEAVKETYGESYPMSMPADDALFTEAFSMDMALVKEYICDTPMMNVHVDTFVGVEAVEGKAEEVETILNAYRDKFIQDKIEFPYLPDHLPKAQGSQVIRIDDYVFFVMVGNVVEIGNTEIDLNQKAKDEVQKGVDAIEEILIKE